MTKPTQAAIEAARERLAKALDADRITISAEMCRTGDYDNLSAVKALAIALQEMSVAVKGAGNSRYLSRDAKDAIATALAPFILPDPVVDPVEQAVIDICKSNSLRSTKGFEAGLIRNALRRGMELAKVQP